MSQMSSYQQLPLIMRPSINMKKVLVKRLLSKAIKMIYFNEEREQKK